MQSGITVSPPLHTAFNALLSNLTHRALLCTIDPTSTSLIPLSRLPSATPDDFYNDLTHLNLPSHLSPTSATYILLRRYPNVSDGFVAITYIPNGAPVRQKMLFASTRLTLVRELGKERFRETLLVNDVGDLEAESWRKREEGGQLGGPLTEEEESLNVVKEAEAEAVGGTKGRRLETGGHLGLKIDDGAREALAGFRESGDNLLQLRINVQTETIELAETGSTDAEGISSAISATEPRYTFFKYTHPLEGTEQSPIVFIYTCPSGSKIKERMVYASTKTGFLAAVSSNFDIEIAKRLEASSPSEITTATLEEEFRPKQEHKQGFSRPKKPGRR